MALQSIHFPKRDRYKVATEMIFLMNLNGEVGKRKHIPVSGYGAVQSSHVPQLQVQSACLDIYTY